MTDMSHNADQFDDQRQLLDPQVEQYFHFTLEEAGAKLASATRAFDAGRYDHMSDDLKDLYRLTTGAVESLPSAPDTAWTERTSDTTRAQRSP